MDLFNNQLVKRIGGKMSVDFASDFEISDCWSMAVGRQIVKISMARVKPR